MPPVRLHNLDRLGPEARRQIRSALESERRAGEQPNHAVEDVSPTPSKLRNVRTVIDGFTFDSLLEAKRYGELKMEAIAGVIADLQVHQRFRLDVNGVHICDYEADFVYRRNGNLIVEDVKSKPTVTRLYRVKKKLLRALHGIGIQEVFEE
jgi:hypothetical protein